jgi:hypothetical protein
MKLPSRCELAQIVFITDRKLRQQTPREYAKVRADSGMGASQLPATAGEGQNPKLEIRNPKEIRNPNCGRASISGRAAGNKLSWLGNLPNSFSLVALLGVLCGQLRFSA